MRFYIHVYSKQCNKYDEKLFSCVYPKLANFRHFHHTHQQVHDTRFTLL